MNEAIESDGSWRKSPFYEILGEEYILSLIHIYFIISELLSKGIDKDEIYRKVYNTYSEGRLRRMGYVLYDKMQVFPQFNSALILSLIHI